MKIQGAFRAYLIKKRYFNKIDLRNLKQIKAEVINELDDK